MTNERLKEIGDSINLQLLLSKHLNDEKVDEMILEEKELYDYTIQLQKENIELQTKLEDKAFEQLKTQIEILKEQNKQLQTDVNNCKERIDKAVDKLYCYGEVFDGKILQQFQKEMINTLQGDKGE